MRMGTRGTAARVRARPRSAAIVVAATLVAALAGTAIAGPEATTGAIGKKKVRKIVAKQIEKRFPVGESGIADGAVTSPKLATDAVDGSKIAAGAVGPTDIDLLEFDRAAATVTVPGSAGQVEFPGDPSVTVNAQPGDVIYIHARVDIRRLTGTGRCNVLLHFDPPGSALDLTTRFAASESPDFETVFADPNEEDVVSGTTSELRAEGRQLPMLAGGPYALDLRYDQGNSTTDCAFRERALWAGIIR
ncbi:MAG: hypothetical protein ACRDL3_14535 [Solirubrobacterales bacterium]